MRDRWKALIARFVRGQEGIAGLEFAILAPVLILLLLGSVALFILYRNAAAAENATFTVADIVSRQTTVNNANLEVDRALFVAMLGESSATVGLRISSVKKSGGTFSVDWSYAVAPLVKMTTATIPTADLPLISDGDSVLVVNSSVSYLPLFSYVGLSGGNYVNVAINRPRFTAAVVKSD